MNSEEVKAYFHSRTTCDEFMMLCSWLERHKRKYLFFKNRFEIERMPFFNQLHMFAIRDKHRCESHLFSVKG